MQSCSDCNRYNAYYFYNLKTKETTWTNPIASAKDKVAPKKDVRALLQGVDPDLAYLDPSLSAAMTTASPSGTVAGSAYGTAGRFNARNGKFEGNPDKNPDWVSDFSRMKRQSNIYFDVDGWEKVCYFICLGCTYYCAATICRTRSNQG